MIFANYPPNRIYGGTEDYTRILVDGLREQFCNVKVITSSYYSGNDPDVYKIGGIAWGLKELFSALKIIRRERFDVVHMQYTPEVFGFGVVFKLLPLLLKFVYPSPLFVITFHTLVGGRWVSKINAVLLSLFSNIVISTNEELSFLFRQYFPFLSGKLHEIPIGSNIVSCKIDPVEAREYIEKKYGLDENVVILSHFGMPNPAKGIEDLFKAFKKVSEKKDYYLLMIGEANKNREEYKEKLLALEKDLGIEGRIIWTGQIDDRDVSLHISASDIFVVPYTDGICIRRGTLMAGISHSMPIISTVARVPTPYFKNNENILLVDSGDHEGIADAISRLSVDRALRKKLSNNIARTADLFLWDKIILKTMHLYGKHTRSLAEKVRYYLKQVVESLEYIVWRIIKKRKRLACQSIEKAPEKILIVQLNAIGDLIMTIPSIRALRARFPTACIDILTQPHTSELLETYRIVDNSYSYCDNFWRLFPGNISDILRNLKVLKALKKNKYDLCVDFTALFGSVVVVDHVCDKEVIGRFNEIKRGLFDFDTNLVYTRSIDVKEINIREANLNVVASLGCGYSQTDLMPLFTKTCILEAEKFIQKYSLKDKDFFVIHPGAKWRPKRWPAEKFSKFIDLIHKETGKITVLTGAIEDAEMLESIKQMSKYDPIICKGELSLLGLGALISRSLAFVGNDSGIGHLAASTGIPCLILFGPTDPALCAPFGGNVNTIREEVPCWPCKLYYRRYHCEMGNNVCLKKLSPNKVFNKINDLLQKSK